MTHWKSNYSSDGQSNFCIAAGSTAMVMIIVSFGGMYSFHEYDIRRNEAFRKDVRKVGALLGVTTVTA